MPQKELLLSVKRIICLEAGTCCYRAGVHFTSQLIQDDAPEFVTATNFYKAIQWLTQNGQAGDTILLPHVSEVCHLVSFNPQFELDEEHVFNLENPPIYLAKGHPKSGNENCCAAIEVLKPLLGQEQEKYIFIEADNTQESARQAKNGQAGYCITNQNGVDKYDLTPVQKLHTSTVVWMPFKFIKLT